MPFATRPTIADAATIANAHMEGVQRSGDKWKAGMHAPRTDPKTAAIASNARYKAQMQAALSADSYLKGVQAIDVEQMLATVDAIGATAYVQGVVARRGKIAGFWQKFIPLLAQLTEKVRAMPQATDPERENRALAMMRGMRELGKALR
jgi:hypothetical protein